MKLPGPKIGSIRIGRRTVKINLGTGTRRIVGSPQYPEIFSRFKGRLRAMLMVDDNPTRQRASTWRLTEHKPPRCASVDYKCMMGGIRLMGNWSMGIAGRVKQKRPWHPKSISTRPG